MEEVIDWLATDRRRKILVLTGVGESWCAGQDIGLYLRHAGQSAGADAINPQVIAGVGEAQDVPQTDHRDGQWLLLRGAASRSCAPSISVITAQTRYMALRGQLGNHSGRIVSWNLMDMTCPPRSLLRGDRRGVRRKAGRRDRSRQFRGAEERFADETVKSPASS